MAATDESGRMIRSAPFRVWYVNFRGFQNNGMRGGFKRDHLIDVDPSPKETLDYFDVGANGSQKSWVSKDFADFAATSGAPTEWGGGNVDDAAGNTGIGYVDLIASEMDAEFILFMAVIAGGSSANISNEAWIPIHPEACLYGASGQVTSSGTKQLTVSTANNAILAAHTAAHDDIFAGGIVEIVRGTGMGQVREVVTYNGANQLFTLDEDWATSLDNTSVYIIKPNVLPTAMRRSYEGVAYGTVNGTPSSAITFVAQNSPFGNLESTTNYYQQGTLFWLNGAANAGQCRRVASNTNLLSFTLDTACTANIAADDPFVIIPARTN